jgi:hypothetical protein
MSKEKSLAVECTVPFVLFYRAEIALAVERSTGNAMSTAACPVYVIDR